MDTPPRSTSNGSPLSSRPETNGSSSLSRQVFERQVAELLEIQVNCQQHMFSDMKTVQNTIQQLKALVDTVDNKTRLLQELVSSITPRLHALQDTLMHLVSEQQHLIPEVVSLVCNKTDSINDNDSNAKQVQTILEAFLKRVTDQMQATVEEHHQALFKMLDTEKLDLLKASRQERSPPTPPPPPPKKPSWPSRMIVCPELSDDEDDDVIQEYENRQSNDAKDSGRQVVDFIMHCIMYSFPAIDLA